MQYLIKLYNETFINDFHVENEDDIKLLAECLSNYLIYNNDELRLMLGTCKHLDCKEIYMNFNKTFTLENIPDDILIHMFDNITNRM